MKHHLDVDDDSTLRPVKRIVTLPAAEATHNHEDSDDAPNTDVKAIPVTWEDDAERDEEDFAEDAAEEHIYQILLDAEPYRVDENGLQDEECFGDEVRVSDGELDACPPVDDGFSPKHVSHSDIARFETHIFTFCTFLHDWCRQTPFEQFRALGDEQPLSFSAFVFVLLSDPSILARKLLLYMPNEVKATFGKPDLSIDDLLSLPLAECCTDGGCYLGIGKKLSEEGWSEVYSPWSTTTVGGEQHEVGVYGGSSFNKEAGIKTRITQHDYEIRKRLAGVVTSKNGTRKYDFMGRDGVQNLFVVLARIPLRTAEARILSPLLEALVQAYLNLVTPTDKVRQ